MGIHIKADRAIRGPLDLEWPAADAVVHVEDEHVARELLAQPFFVEVDPAQHGRHEAPVPDPEAEPEDGDDAADETKKAARTRKTPVTE